MTLNGKVIASVVLGNLLPGSLVFLALLGIFIAFRRIVRRKRSQQFSLCDDRSSIPNVVWKSRSPKPRKPARILAQRRKNYESRVARRVTRERAA